MSVKQTERKITALYERLSRDDDNAGDRLACKSYFVNFLEKSRCFRCRR